MKLAFPNPEGPVFEWSEELRNEAIHASRESARRRMLVPIHRDQRDLVQRMVNVLQPGSYIQPHHHPRDSATETILVMEGVMGFIVFDDSGEVVSTHRIPSGGLVDIEERVWHGVVALEPDTIILETKRGPYNQDDKIFAEWAPVENEPEAITYLENLENLFCNGSN